MAHFKMRNLLKIQPTDPVYSPDDELNRSKVFRYLFECEKVSNGRSAWFQLKNIMADFKKSQNTAENYIIEYLTQYESVLEKYVHKKDQIFGPTHYKTLSAMLQKFYTHVPPFPPTN